MSTANTLLHIAQLFDLKSSSDPPFFVETLVHSWGWATHLATERHRALLLASTKERWQLDPRIVTPHLVTRRSDVRDTGMAQSGPSPRRFL